MTNLRLIKDKDSQLNFQLRSKDKKKKYAELVLYGTIGEDFFGEGITGKAVSEELRAFGEIENLDVRINSMGGDVFDGVTIYNRLKQLNANITVYVDGLAASIASIIAMAGDEIIMSEGSLFMIHSPMTGVFGNQRDMEEKIQVLDTIEEEMLSIYAKRTGMSRSELRTMVHAETWFGSEEAIEMGFASKVDEELNIAACADASVKYYSKMYKNLPTEKIVTQSDIVKRKLKNINSNIEDFLTRK
jgi:ATP-dependent Clp protease protease subunit